MTPSEKQVERLALIRVGALGDLLVGLAAICEAMERFAHAEVSIVGPKLWTEILSPLTFPRVTRILALEKKGASTAVVYRPVGDTWLAEGPPGDLVGLLRGHDAVVNFHIDSYRYGFASLRAGIPMRIGSTPPSMAWLYTHVSPFLGKDPLVHERDSALLTLEMASNGLAKFLHPIWKNRASLNNWLAKSALVTKWRAKGLPSAVNADPARARALTGVEPGRYLVVNPTSSRREKSWTAEKFRELLLSTRAGLNSAGLQALVVGSPAETDWLREVAGEDFTVVQPPSIRDLQHVLASAKGLLTNTSSVQFIAAMTKTPAVVLMGRGRPEIWGPLGVKDRVIRGTPPAELAHDIFRQEEAAYRSITVESVREAWLQLAK